MACNFLDGLQLVSNSTIVAAPWDPLRPFEANREAPTADYPGFPLHLIYPQVVLTDVLDTGAIGVFRSRSFQTGVSSFVTVEEFNWQ